jgi:AraC-like DNA-binding protein
MADTFCPDLHGRDPAYYPAAMVVMFRDDIARLWETAVGAPFFATELVVFTTGMLQRHYLEIMLVTEGAGRLEILHGRDEPYVRVLRPGTLLLFRPSDSARFVVRDPRGLLTRYVSFSEADWGSFTAMVGLDPSWATVPWLPVVTTDPSDATVLAPFETAIARFRSEPTRLDLVRFLSDTAPLLFPRYREVDAGRRGAPDWLVTSLEAMQDEENLRLGVSRMLELAHVSSSYLSINVRRFFDSTPTHLVLGFRLRHAAMLLATTTHSVAEVSTRCGFGSVTYFSTAFRRRFQTTPREYRARARGGAVAVSAS